MLSGAISGLAIVVSAVLVLAVVWLFVAVITEPNSVPSIKHAIPNQIILCVFLFDTETTASPSTAMIDSPTETATCCSSFGAADDSIGEYVSGLLLLVILLLFFVSAFLCMAIEISFAAHPQKKQSCGCDCGMDFRATTLQIFVIHRRMAWRLMSGFALDGRDGPHAV